MECRNELRPRTLLLQDISAQTGLTVESLKTCLSGRIQYRQQVANTHFVPGKWSVNPVTLIKHSVTSRDGTGMMPVQKKIPFQNGLLLTGPFCSTNISFDTNGRFTTVGTKPDYTAWDTRLASLALVKAHAKLASADVFDVGVWLGELPETIAGLRNPLSALRKFLQRKQFRNPGKLLDASSGTWLEYRYGIRPLIGDIQNVIELIASGIKKRNSALTVKRSTVSTTGKWSGNYYASIGNVTSVKGTAQSVWKKKVTAGIGFTTNFGLLPELSRYGLSPTQLPGIAFELMKLSFVLDWVFNVGKWISAIMPNPSASIVGNFVSQKTSETIELRVPQIWGAGNFGYRTVDAPFHTTIETDCLRRAVGQDLPVLPVMEVNIVKLMRVLDSVSLIWQSLPSSWRNGYNPNHFQITPKNIRRI